MLVVLEEFWLVEVHCVALQPGIVIKELMLVQKKTGQNASAHTFVHWTVIMRTTVFRVYVFMVNVYVDNNAT